MITLLIIGLLLASGTIIARYALSFQGFSAFLLAPTVACLLIIIPGTLIYIPWQLPAWIASALCITPILAALPLIFRNIPTLKSTLTLRIQPTSLHAALAAIIHLLIISSCFAVLWTHQTTSSLVGPWEAVSGNFFIPLCASLIAHHFVIRQPLPQWWQLIALCLQYLVVASVTAITFPLAYGFDPQIHLATAEIISEQGFVSPKQPYYLGYYVLLTTLSQGLSVSLATVNQWLMPIIVSTLLPTLTYLALLKKFQRDSLALTGALIFLILPLFPFSSLTPWGLATTFAIAVVLTTTQNSSMLLPALLTIAAGLIHPIPGIMAFGYLCFYKLYAVKRSYFPIILCSGVILSLPLTFLIADSVLPQISISIGWYGDTDLLTALSDYIFPTRYRAILDAVYFMRTILIGTICVAAGLLVANFFKSLNQKHRVNDAQAIAGYFGVCLMSSGALCYLFLRFSSLAANEQSDYSLRIITLGALCILPWITFKLTPLVWTGITDSRRSIRAALILLLAGTSTAATYHAYPHRDAFIAYHGYSISGRDIAAVNMIDTHGTDDTFVVLSNQMLAAASIRAIGFKHYFHPTSDSSASYFYYPIPASSPLRPLYEQMLKTPTRETARLAADTADATRVYFATPSYESGFLNLTDDYKKYGADGYMATDDETVKIYWYNF